MNGNGFDVVDIHSLSTPFGTSHWRSGNQTHGIYADNGLLFIADNYGGVPIFSLEDPSNPELISNIVTNSFVQDVYSKDSLLYLATIDPWDYDGGIYIYNISEPAIPIEISHVPLPSVHSFLNSILPWNNYIFVAESDSGVGIYDAHDKYNPQFIEWHHSPPSALDLAISGNRLFVVDYSSGLYCLDISDPYHIADLGSVGIGTAYAVDINNDLAFVATTDSGLVAYDISDPYNMRLAGRSEDVSWCTEILAIGDTLFVTTVYDGLVILRFNEAEGIDDEYQNSIAPKLSVTNYPNPFNSSTTLKYSIPANTTEKLAIFDILGRNVREFEISGNKHEIIWDGIDQSGNSISSGVYFFAIKDHPETAKKMILLR